MSTIKLFPFSFHVVNPACNPLKHRYDACFIKWVEGYLEPLPFAAAPSSSTPTAVSAKGAKPIQQQQTVDPAIRAKEKADEYEALCGASWREYEACVWVRVISIPFILFIYQPKCITVVSSPPPSPPPHLFPSPFWLVRKRMGISAVLSEEHPR